MPDEKSEIAEAPCLGSNGRGLTRRGFMGAVTKAAAGAVVGSTAWRTRRAAASTAANNRINLALIGCGGMGNRHLESLLQRDDCRVAAVCDVFKPRYEAAQAKVGGDCKGYQDYRRVLDRNDVDAVLCATPDHWHALIEVNACQAGKDVYVEKPISTTILEGRAMVDAARRYDRVVQVGTQQRSLDLFKKAVDIVHRGTLGTVTSAGAWIGANAIAPMETHEPIPDGLDWDMWLGPAPWVPYSPQRHYGFRAFHDYANGELTNWGVHLLDIVLWGIKQDRPLMVESVGGSYRAISGSDDYENVDLLYEFEGCTITWEQRHNHTHANKSYGMKFLGTDGRMFIDRTSFVVEPASLGIEETFETGDPWIDVQSHQTNFFDCIRTRNRPNSDIELGHRATTVCLLGGIALDCRRKLVWNGDAERVVRDEQANRHLFRPYRAPWHL